MRSNIARTWGSSSVPLDGPSVLVIALGRRLLELRQEPDHLSELLGRVLREVRERRHRRGRVDQRALDRLAGQTGADLGQLRARPVVAVLADLVARQAARLRDHLTALLELLHRG